MTTKNIYFYCTWLVSTIDIRCHVSEHDVRPVIYFGGPRPQALGVDHAIGAMPKIWLGDGCARGRSRLEGRDIHGVIPRPRLQYINVWYSRSRVGALQLFLKWVVAKHPQNSWGRVIWMFAVGLSVHCASYLYYIIADWWEFESRRERECNLLWDRGEAVCVTLTRK
jgi:hypothetical protein